MKLWIPRRRVGSAARLAAMVLGLLVLPLGLFVPLAAAQTAGAALNGTITDTSGAAIPGASVTVTSQEQGIHFTTTTNAAGVYNLPSIPTGSYTLTATARGFQTAKQGPFTLVLNQTAQVNLRLSVGEQSQTVSVTGQAPLLQTETTETATNLNATANVTLPLLQRNYSQLTLLSPGAVTPSPTASGSMGGADLYVNGNRAQNNNFLLDGVDNNQTTENAQGYSPSPDAIQQFTVISSNASAQYGNFAGGIISAEIKAGTNQWHGNLYEFVQNDKLNANNWANNFNGGSRAKLRYNDFGGTVGGPVLKNKLFVFGDYDGVRNDTPNSTSPITLFTAAERTGDFGAICTGNVDKNGAPGTFTNGVCSIPGDQLYLPSSGTAASARTVVPNNNFANVPGGVTAVEDPVAAELFSHANLYPEPTSPGLLNNYLNTSRSFTNTNQGDIRVDYNVSSTNHVFWRGSMLRSSGEATNSFPLLLPTSQPGRDWNSVLDWTHTIGGAFVNDAKVGLNYVGGNGIVLPTAAGNIADTLGIAGGNAVPGPGLMLLNFGQSSLTSLGNSNTFGLRGASVITYEDNIVITEGRHLIHTGFQGMRYRSNYFYPGNSGLYGQMVYNGQFTGNGTTTGFDGADFFLGLPSLIGHGPSNGIFGQRNNVYGAYVQDDWHATGSLTLNLGLRYQNFRPIYEIHNREVNFGPISGTIYTAGTTDAEQFYGDGRALYRPTNGLADWQPRLGFAWTPMSSTVVRGSWGTSTFMEGTGLNLRPTINPPFGAEYQANYNSLEYPSTKSETGLSQLAPPPGGIQQYDSATLRLWSPDLQPAVVEQWNLSIQRQLNNSTTFQVGYLGQHSTHLVTPVQLMDAVLPQDCALNHGSIEGIPCGNSAAVLPAGADPAATAGYLAPSPYLSGNSALASAINNVSATFTDGVHTYNALQAIVQRRFANGLQYQGSYTWSKCMSDSGGFYGDGGQTSAAGEVYAQDTYNQRGEYGPCFNDTTNLISSYVIYASPFGAGKAYNLGSVGNAVLGNWQVSGTWNWHTGFAFSPVGNNNTGNGDFACCRMNCNGPAVYSKSSSPQGGIQWFSTSPFSEGAPGVMPTCGRGVVRGPGLDTINMSLMRNVAVGGESRYVQLRADFNNLFNHPILDAPNVGDGPTLGLIQGSEGERSIQLALKFYF